MRTWKCKSVRVAMSFGDCAVLRGMGLDKSDPSCVLVVTFQYIECRSIHTGKLIRQWLLPYFLRLDAGLLDRYPWTSVMANRQWILLRCPKNHKLLAVLDRRSGRVDRVSPNDDVSILLDACLVDDDEDQTIVWRENTDMD